MVPAAKDVDSVGRINIIPLAYSYGSYSHSSYSCCHSACPLVLGRAFPIEFDNHSCSRSELPGHVHLLFNGCIVHHLLVFVAHLEDMHPRLEAFRLTRRSRSVTGGRRDFRSGRGGDGGDQVRVV